MIGPLGCQGQQEELHTHNPEKSALQSNIDREHWAKSAARLSVGAAGKKEARSLTSMKTASCDSTVWAARYRLQCLWGWLSVSNPGWRRLHEADCGQCRLYKLGQQTELLMGVFWRRRWGQTHFIPCRAVGSRGTSGDFALEACGFCSLITVSEGSNNLHGLPGRR